MPTPTADIGYNCIQEIIGDDHEIRYAANSKDAPALKDDIEMERVCFRYTPERQILKDVSLKIPAGTTVALVGPTGSGKTTIANLINC